jgi:hypothetical protein
MKTCLPCEEGDQPYIDKYYLFTFRPTVQGWVNQAIFRVESSRVESPVFPSRFKSSQIIFSIISFSVYFDKSINKFFMTHYPVHIFYSQKNNNSPTEDKMT